MESQHTITLSSDVKLCASVIFSQRTMWFDKSNESPNILILSPKFTSVLLIKDVQYWLLTKCII